MAILLTPSQWTACFELQSSKRRTEVFSANANQEHFALAGTSNPQSGDYTTGSA